MKKNVIDLFAGCGGFSVGFEQAGFNISKAVEIDKQISVTYKENHKTTELYNEDIGKIDNNCYFKENEAEVIIGGPPCQGFSMAGARIRNNSFIDDPRNYLFKHYVNVVKLVKPKVFLFENVKGILSMKEGNIFKEIISSLSDKNNFDGIQYHLYHKVLDSSKYGIPEKRQRVIILGCQKEINLDQLEKNVKNKILTKYPHFFDDVTIRDAIYGLPSPSQDGTVHNVQATSEYQKYLKSSKNVITNHLATKHSDVAIKRMNKIKTGENFSSLNENINSVHSGSYGRMDMDEPSVTITTRFDTPSGGRFIHPEEDRTITPREAARIQSFPDDFVFWGSKTSICKQIGNAVPPKLAFYLANLVKEII